MTYARQLFVFAVLCSLTACGNFPYPFSHTPSKATQNASPEKKQAPSSSDSDSLENVQLSPGASSHISGTLRSLAPIPGTPRFAGDVDGQSVELGSHYLIPVPVREVQLVGFVSLASLEAGMHVELDVINCPGGVYCHGATYLVLYFSVDFASYVSSKYQTILGRSADAGGLAAFVGSLQNGATAAQISTALATSAEAAGAIDKLYRTYLRRGVDSGGLAAWVGALVAGRSLEDVRQGLLGSAEYAQLQSAPSPGSPASPPPKAAPACGTLPSGASLSVGMVLRSCSGQYQLVLQSDGNLVVYGPGGALWHTLMYGAAGNQAAMQADGNFVLYNGGATWSSSTSGYPGAILSMQDDGNLVVYSGSSALWSWRTGNLIGR